MTNESEHSNLQAELVRKLELALQAPLPEPSLTAPAWTEPEQLWPEEPQPEPAALIDPLVDLSVNPFNPIDPVLEAPGTEVSVDQNEFFVPFEPMPAPNP